MLQTTSHTQQNKTDDNAIRITRFHIATENMRWTKPAKAVSGRVDPKTASTISIENRSPTAEPTIQPINPARGMVNGANDGNHHKKLALNPVLRLSCTALFVPIITRIPRTV
jgi:hypothetical protein